MTLYSTTTQQAERTTCATAAPAVVDASACAVVEPAMSPRLSKVKFLPTQSPPSGKVCAGTQQQPKVWRPAPDQNDGGNLTRSFVAVVVVVVRGAAPRRARRPARAIENATRRTGVRNETP